MCANHSDSGSPKPTFARRRPVLDTLMLVDQRLRQLDRICPANSFGRDGK